MKKSVFISAIAALLVLFTSCESTKNAAEAEAAAQEEKKNYVGWVDASSKDIIFRKGIIQLKIKPNLGSYGVSVYNENEKQIPVTSTANEFTSSAMYLKTSKKIFKLIPDSNLNVNIDKGEDNVKITYSIANTAEVLVSFDFYQTSVENDFNVMKVTSKITNKMNKKEEFTFKQIMDTVLGETGTYHFYSGDNSPVRNEELFRNAKLAEQKWFLSKNNNAAMQIFFNGKDTTLPEQVALANYSTLSKNGWEPDMLTFRTFDTVLSYNNSAIGVIWPSVKLMPKESTEIIYYYVFATDSNPLEGEKFIYGEPVEKPVEYVSPLEMVVEEKKAEAPVEKDVYVPKQEQKVEFNVESLSKEQFSPEYIQNLIDRITILEENSSAVNREELLQLNAELDAILSALRQ